MATTPPIYSFPGLYYNPVFFPSISGFLTLSQANTLYLARSGVASSVAILTSFTGAVTINGLLTLNGGLTLTGGLTVDTLTVNTLSTLNTNTIINNILTINATNSIVGQTTFTLAPILPSGYQFLTTGTQTITGLKTFSSVITSNGINDSLSITSPNITGSTIVNGGTFNATNIAGTSNFYGATISGTLSCNAINNTSSILPITISFQGTSSIPTATDAIRALRIGWNGYQPGQGATDFINCSQGGNGGFSFSATNTNFASKQLASLYTGGGLRLYSDCAGFRIDDTNNGAFNLTTTQQGNTSYFNSSGISTSISSACGNASGVLTTVLVLNTNFISTFVPFTPQSTSLFNVSHPTTTLGNNISTNTTQYATVGYVNANSGASLLPLNNTWTGTNTFQLPIITSGLTNYPAGNPIAITFPLGATPLPATTTGDSRNGFLIGWNGLTGSNGETDFTNLNQGGNQGGFLFGNIPNGASYQKLASLLPLNAGGLRLWPYCGNLRVDDSTGGLFSANMRQDGALSIISSVGISTSLFLQCGNVSGVATNVMSMNTTTVQPLVNFSPQSTTTFNVSHPTTTLGNNISTNTTQYATVGYVSSAITSASILPLNNTFTGLNTFTQIIQMTIKTDPSTTAIGTGAGGNLSTLATGSSNTFYGSSAGIVSTLCNNETVIGANSGVMTAGNQSYNTVIGSGSRYLGTGNTVIGSLAGNFSTTVAYNNSTCIGTGSLITASNQITIGRATETVLIPGTANINGTLTTTGTTNINNTFMTGTAVVNNDLQVNGNIIQTLGTVFTLPVTTVFTSIPPYILYIPTTSMGFTLPVPSAAFAGQTFTIRRLNTGGNQIVGFTCPGSPAVWWGLSFGAAATAFNVNTIWQATFLCLSGGYYQIS